ncbi:MAG TPA: hypothetical protein VJB16_00915, partial [archaeon]|nr:hypothetical protein [archaeon]
MTLQALASYDAQGHFIQSGERFRDYAARIERRLARLQELEQPGNGVYGLPPEYDPVVRELSGRFALEPVGVERVGSVVFAGWN